METSSSADGGAVLAAVLPGVPDFWSGTSARAVDLKSEMRATRVFPITAVA